MNQAIGMIETKGLLAMIEATDAMLKSSDVHCLGRKEVGSGLNAVLIAGDVAAVETAVQAGVASVQRLGLELLAGSHVIPRPNIDALSFVDTTMTEAVVLQATEIIETIIPEEPVEQELSEVAVEELEIEVSPVLIEISPKEKLFQELQQMKVTELRKLAKEQTNFSIPQNNIHSAKKEKLIKALIESLIINE